MSRNGPTRAWRRIRPIRSAFDRGLAPFQIMVNLKAAHDALGPHDSLEGLTIGVRLDDPGAARSVPQPHHAQFVIYDGARRHRGQVRLREPADARRARSARRAYGHHFGATFTHRRIAGRTPSIALLWAKEDGYWKIVSWQAEPEPDDDAGCRRRTPAPTVVRIKADLTLVARGEGLPRSLVDSQGLRRGVSIPVDAEATRATTSCEALTRRRQHRPTMPAGRSAPVSNASANGSAAAQSRWTRSSRPSEPLHPSIRVMDQPYTRALFSLTSFPDRAWRRRRVRRPRPWPAPARSPAARIRQRLRHDVPLSARRAATRRSCACSGGRRTAPGASRRTTSSCRSPAIGIGTIHSSGV